MGDLSSNSDIASGKFQKRVGAGDPGKNPFAVEIPEIFQRQIRGNDRSLPAKGPFIQNLKKAGYRERVDQFGPQIVKDQQIAV